MSCFFKSIFKMFSPSYIYTLDKSFLCENKRNWLFKEFGTHTYIVKTWSQLQEGNFIRGLNPKDIAYIAQEEVRKVMENNYLRISEEKRGGIYTLSCADNNISITAEDFLKNYALVSRTEHHDVLRIAYFAGLQKGRVISSCDPGRIASHENNKRQILTVIK